MREPIGTMHDADFSYAVYKYENEDRAIILIWRGEWGEPGFTSWSGEAWEPGEYQVYSDEVSDAILNQWAEANIAQARAALKVST